MKYKYTGSGVMAFWVEGKRYEVGVHPRLSIEVELPKKVNIEGLELVDESKQDKKKKNGD